jgi:Flp pilus assembly protein TadD
MDERINKLGNAKKLIEDKQFLQAEQLLNNYLSLYPDDRDGLHLLGIVFQSREEFEKAIYYYRKCLDINSNNPEILKNIGLSLMGMRLFEKAIEIFKVAIEISPQNVKLHNNLAILYDLTGNFEKAKESFYRAIEFDGSYWEAYQNLSHTYSYLGDLNKAEYYNEKALMLNPDSVDANFDRAIIKLNKGDFPAAWKDYEWRLKKDLIGFKNFSKPRLIDQPVQDKTVVVYDEQGFGDTIQFVRFIPLLKQKGCKIVLMTHEKLVDLMVNSNVADTVLPKKDGSYNFEYDYHIPLLSIPFYLGIKEEEIPKNLPYLFVDEKLIVSKSKLFKSCEKLKVGIVWRGKQPIGNEHRTASLKDYIKLSSIPVIQLYSLQADTLTGEEKELLKENKIIDLSREIRNFYNTAAVMMNLDLIITIDTYSAHLAGALGKEVWTILSFKSDWRWKSVNDVSIWYPGMKLFKQYKFGEWQPVFERVYNNLLLYIND